MAYTLEEVGLLDPRDRQPIRSAWDGLERLLLRSCQRSKAPSQLDRREEETMGDEKIKMEAERAVYYNGELVSDASEHEEWLDSPEGDRLFMAMALREIHKTLTPEQVKRLYFPEESVTLEEVKLRYFPAEPGPPEEEKV
jgi:hypothetical protein